MRTDEGLRTNCGTSPDADSYGSPPSQEPAEEEARWQDASERIPSPDNPLSKEELAKLVELARQGDAVAFSQIYEHWQGELYKYALYILGNRYDAEDVVSECFIEAFRGIKNLREPAAFKGWIFKILSIRCKRRIGEFIRARNTLNVDDFLQLPSDSPALDETSVENVQLLKALEEIKPDERMILILSAVHGYTTKEIAAILGRPHGTVSARLHRTYGKLRALIGR